MKRRAALPAMPCAVTVLSSCRKSPEKAEAFVATYNQEYQRLG
jgi:hypothetical protein